MHVEKGLKRSSFASYINNCNYLRIGHQRKDANIYTTFSCNYLRICLNQEYILTGFIKLKI